MSNTSKFSDEFKAKAVARIASGESATAVAAPSEPYGTFDP